MTWVRLDDSYPDHPKVQTAGPAAELAHVRAMCYASHYLTNGFIPDAVVPKLTLGLAGDPVGALEAHGLWHRSLEKAGWFLHDFLDYNPKKSAVLARRRAQSTGGKKGAKRRWRKTESDNGSTHGVTHGVTQGGTHKDLYAPLPLPRSRRKTPVLTRVVDTTRARDATVSPEGFSSHQNGNGPDRRDALRSVVATLTERLGVPR